MDYFFTVEEPLCLMHEKKEKERERGSLHCVYYIQI